MAENIFLAKEPRKYGFADREAMVRGTRQLLERVGMGQTDPNSPLERLNTASQQMVAIARALSFDARLIIMDEPTSSLHDREVDTLFRVIRQLKADGVSVIFISHKLDELYRICDQITVLRDGATVLTGALSDLSRLDLVATMLGRKPEAIAAGAQTAFTRAEQRTTGETLLRAQGVASWPRLRNASLSVRSGEILGIAGLLGSGRSELASAIFGAGDLNAGTFELDGRPYRAKNPRAAIRAGVALTPEDRKTEGLVGIMSIADNMTLSILKRISRFGFISRRKERELANEYAQRLGVRMTSLDQPVKELSGGNQQKVLLARSLAVKPRLLILDEPTRGVDVGAKLEIQRIISDIADKDRGVILISSEMEEIAEASDRIHVLRDGESVASLDARSVTNAQIMIYMASGDVAEEEEVSA